MSCILFMSNPSITDMVEQGYKHKHKIYPCEELLKYFIRSTKFSQMSVWQ